jgi:hypothetical protein
MRTQFLLESPKERFQLVELGVDGRVILEKASAK